MKVATSAEQQTSFCICGEFDFVLGQPQSADLSKGVDQDLAAIWKIGHFMLSDSRG